MPKSNNDNVGSPITFEAVVKQAITDWARQKGSPDPIVLNDAMIGGLALLITYRLMRARLVTFDRTASSPAPDEPSVP